MMELKDRILLDNGISVLTPEQAAEIIFEEGELPDYIRVFGGDDTDSYHRFYLKDVAFKGDEPTPRPSLFYDEDKVMELVDYLYTNRRDSDIDTQTHQDRIEKELDFFIKENAIAFLLKVWDLIDCFKREGKVWGVGRGSSCASYLLYIMEVHDVNPIRYDIPFSEFSKEYD